MLKGTLLYLANRRPVYRLVMRHDLLRGLTQRYVAGEELADGIVVAQTLNTQGLLARRLPISTPWKPSPTMRPTPTSH